MEQKRISPIFTFILALPFWGKSKIVEFRIPLLITQENWDLPSPSPASKDRLFPSPRVRRKTGLAKLRSEGKGNVWMSDCLTSPPPLPLFRTRTHSGLAGENEKKNQESRSYVVAALVLMRCQGEKEEEEEIVASSSFLSLFSQEMPYLSSFFFFFFSPWQWTCGRGRKGRKRRERKRKCFNKKCLKNEM